MSSKMSHPIKESSKRSASESSSSQHVEQRQKTSHNEDSWRTAATVNENREIKEAPDFKELPSLSQKISEHMEDVPDEHMEDVPDEHMEDAPEEHIQDAPEEHMEDAPQEHMEDTAEEHMEDSREENMEDAFTSCKIKYDECIKGPYVPMKVEEVSVVTSLQHWTNINVRVVGMFLVTDCGSHVLRGVGVDDHGDVVLNLEYLDQYPCSGATIEVFGRLHVYQHADDENIQEEAGIQEVAVSKVKIIVMFYTKVNDVRMRKKTLSLLKPYIPLFFK